MSGRMGGGARLAAVEGSMDRVGGGRGLMFCQHDRWKLVQCPL